MEALLSDVGTSMPIPVSVWLTRLFGVVLFCGIIGFEREVGLRPAGLRTHILIGLASALYTLITIHLVQSELLSSERVRTDPVRIVEAVTQGVAFLAAGLVVFSRGNVRGLKTGATMWLCAAIGVACALGIWQVAAVVTGMALFVIVVVRMIEKMAGTHTEGHAPKEGEG